MTGKPLGWVRLVVLELIAISAVPGIWAATSGGWRIAFAGMVVAFQAGILIEAYRTWAGARRSGNTPTTPN